IFAVVPDVPQRGSLAALAKKRQLIGTKANLRVSWRIQESAQKRSQVTAAGDSRKIIDLGKYAAPGERYENSEGKRGGTDTTAGQSKANGMSLVGDFIIVSAPADRVAFRIVDFINGHGLQPATALGRGRLVDSAVWGQNSPSQIAVHLAPDGVL